MKLKIIQMPLEVIVKFLIILCVSCNSYKMNDKIFTDDQLAYELINTINYRNGVLNRTTLSYEELSQKNLLKIDEISDRNYKNNWVFENEPYVNFDTIFSNSQKYLINENFKKLQKVKLNPRKLKYTNALSKNGQTLITFPFVQEGKDGILYAFLVQMSSPESSLYIFVRNKEGWQEFAKVALGIS